MHNFANPFNMYKLIMRNSPGKIALVLIAALSVSCTGYNKLLKSKDHEAKYNKAVEYYEKKKYSKTIQLLADIHGVYQNTEKEEDILYYLGAALYKMGDFLSAQEALDHFRKSYGRSPYLEDVEYMYAKSFYFSSPSHERDQSMTIKAMTAIREYLAHYPNSSKKEALLENMQELQQKLYDKSFYNARLYYKIGYYNSAVVALRNAIDEFPQSPHNEELYYLIVSSWHKFALGSVHSKQRERFQSMEDSYYSFIAEYPESKYRKEVEQMHAEATKFLKEYGNKSVEKEVFTPGPDMMQSPGV